MENSKTFDSSGLVVHQAGDIILFDLSSVSFEDEELGLEGDAAVDLRNEEIFLPVYYEAPISIECGVVSYRGVNRAS